MRMFELKKCKYCGGDAQLTTIEDTNYLGEKGFKTTIFCKICRVSVERWGRNRITAETRARSSWNGVIG